MLDGVGEPTERHSYGHEFSEVVIQLMHYGLPRPMVWAAARHVK